MNALSIMHPEDAYTIRKAFFHQVKDRAGILKLEQWVNNLPNVVFGNPFPLFHSFTDGMYIREIHIPAGSFVVGAIHKRDYFINVLKGKLWAVSEYGAKEIEAPCSFKAKAGSKHIVFTTEDTVWQDTHKTDFDTVDDAEADILCNTYKEYDETQGIFNDVCRDIGMTESEAYNISRIIDDLISQPFEDKVLVKRSEIQGYGTFAAKGFKESDIICKARIENSRTPAGRYTNHSDDPNAEMVIEGNKGIFSALTEISNGSEITVDYRKTREIAILLDEAIKCQQQYQQQ